MCDNSKELKIRIREFICQWLMNEQLIGEETIEIVEWGKLNENPKSYKLNKLSQSALKCKKCDLYRERKNLVFGQGKCDSSLVFIGEAPGREEDKQGIPFVGEAGKLLTHLLKSIGINRDEVYITNVIKCRPPGNRDPLPHEINKCSEWLCAQLEILSPKIICTLGRYATHFLIGRMGTDSTSGKEKTLPYHLVRGKIYEYKGAKVIPTYHPAALLYHPKWKEDTIRDLELVKKSWITSDTKDKQYNTGGCS